MNFNGTALYLASLPWRNWGDIDGDCTSTGTVSAMEYLGIRQGKVMQLSELDLYYRQRVAWGMLNTNQIGGSAAEAISIAQAEGVARESLHSVRALIGGNSYEEQIAAMNTAPSALAVADRPNFKIGDWAMLSATSLADMVAKVQDAISRGWPLVIPLGLAHEVSAWDCDDHGVGGLDARNPSTVPYQMSYQELWDRGGGNGSAFVIKSVNFNLTALPPVVSPFPPVQPSGAPLVNLVDFRGFNLTTKPGHPAERSNFIDWDWSGWIRPQIDCAIAAGSTCIRVLGDAAMVADGTLSQTLYNSRMLQLVTYCAVKGVSVYLTGCATYDTNGGDNGTVALTNAQIASVIISNVAALSAYESSIMALDIVNEANVNLSAARVNALYGLIRPNVPASIPCTFSDISKVQDTAWLDSVINSCDIIDKHIYPQIYGIGAMPAPADFMALNVRYPSKQIVIGEGGIDTSQYSDQQVSDWIIGLTKLGDLDCVKGVLLWAAQDQDQPYGAFTAAWAPRVSVFVPWFKWATLSYLPAPVSTTAPPATSLIAGDGAVWTLGAPSMYGNQILRNGVSAAGGQGTTISFKNNQIRVMNNLGNWYLWTGVGPQPWANSTAP